MVCSEAAARNMNAGLEICANFSPWRVKEVSDILSVPPSVVQVMNTECFAYFREGVGKRCFFLIFISECLHIKIQHYFALFEQDYPAHHTQSEKGHCARPLLSKRPSAVRERALVTFIASEGPKRRKEDPRQQIFLCTGISFLSTKPTHQARSYFRGSRENHLKGLFTCFFRPLSESARRGREGRPRFMKTIWWE